MFFRDLTTRLWVLSFVLAPYTHLLSQTVHVPPSKKLVDRIIPPLVQRHLDEHAHMVHSALEHDSDSASASHTQNLCAQCQAAAQQGCPTTQSKRDRGVKKGVKQAAPTELQADSSAASLQQPQSPDVAEHSSSAASGTLSSFGM